MVTIASNHRYDTCVLESFEERMEKEIFWILHSELQEVVGGSCLEIHAELAFRLCLGSEGDCNDQPVISTWH